MELQIRYVQLVLYVMFSLSHKEFWENSNQFINESNIMARKSL